MLESYRDLRVWQAGMDVAEACYRLTQSFPREEVYGLSSQIRRAATSIPANIAEGYGRGGRGEYVQFLGIAQGSLKELETHMLIAQRLGFGPTGALAALLGQADQLGRMLSGLIRALKITNGTGGHPSRRAITEEDLPYEYGNTPSDLDATSDTLPPTPDTHT